MSKTLNIRDVASGSTVPDFHEEALQKDYKHGEAPIHGMVPKFDAQQEKEEDSDEVVERDALDNEELHVFNFDRCESPRSGAASASAATATRIAGLCSNVFPATAVDLGSSAELSNAAPLRSNAAFNTAGRNTRLLAGAGLGIGALVAAGGVLAGAFAAIPMVFVPCWFVAVAASAGSALFCFKNT
uniref:Transmembrane protein n=1 Tax=Ditylenchus dipsaci TaxID=166011 RepID=A0A915DI37_9BILA